jgi:hypothetical protein
MVGYYIEVFHHHLGLHHISHLAHLYVLEAVKSTTTSTATTCKTSVVGHGYHQIFCHHLVIHFRHPILWMAECCCFRTMQGPPASSGNPFRLLRKKGNNCWMWIHLRRGDLRADGRGSNYCVLRALPYVKLYSWHLLDVERQRWLREVDSKLYIPLDENGWWSSLRSCV